MRQLSYLTFASLAIFIALTFRHYGISNDEEVQHVYGRLLIDFYASGFTDQSAFHYRNLYLYGGLFDLAAAGIERMLGLAPESAWIWDIRHLLSALFGLAGILAAYKTASIFGGERAGFLAVMLLSITGAWTGAMFTHTKDIPFATCMAWASYYLILLSQKLPRPPLLLSVKLGAAVGFALGLRIGAGFAVIYLLLVVMLAALLQPGPVKHRLHFLYTSFIGLLPAGVVAFILMAIFWPWGIMSPDHPFEAIRSFSHFTFNMLTVLDGDVMNIGEVPRNYLPAYLLVRLPEIFLLGLLAALLLVIIHCRKARPREPFFLAWASLVLSATFPLFFALWDKPALYNGIRHFTFILPPLAVIAAVALNHAWVNINRKPALRMIGEGMAGMLVANTLVILMLLHPYEYVYYNHLAGSLKEAGKEWEGDYWSSSIREAAALLDDFIDVQEASNQNTHQGQYNVAVCAEKVQADTFLDDRFNVTTDWVNADFYISSTNMHCDQVLQGKLIGKVERMGATLAVIKDRRHLDSRNRRPKPAPN